MSRQIVFTEDIASKAEKILSSSEYDRLFILTDENTHRYSLPLLAESRLSDAKEIIIAPDDTHKTVESLVSVWQALGDGGATRKSLLVNLGGGMVTDLGGFAAATFKRGINNINIPTTLLGAVDAAVGGKTGINFGGLKNEIGSFKQPECVIISTQFFRTLAKEHLLSGFAEMLKHGLINTKESYNKLLSFNLYNPDYKELLKLVEESVAVKERVVTEDPFEKGIRKSLNLGHTVGHAFESLALKRNAPVQHGYAIAWGLVCEMLLSHMKLKFSEKDIRRLSDYIYENYGVFKISCDDYPFLYEKICHDKKNEGNRINFTLLRNI
ncbi:MAG: 3-dehydroquinate synthase, partial [Bacteroidales bacterium]